MPRSTHGGSSQEAGPSRDPIDLTEAKITINGESRLFGDVLCELWSDVKLIKKRTPQLTTRLTKINETLMAQDGALSDERLANLTKTIWAATDGAEDLQDEDMEDQQDVAMLVYPPNLDRLKSTVKTFAATLVNIMKSRGANSPRALINPIIYEKMREALLAGDYDSTAGRLDFQPADMFKILMEACDEIERGELTRTLSPPLSAACRRPDTDARPPRARAAVVWPE